MKTYWGVEVQLHALTLALHGSEWSDLRACCFSPDKRALGTHWIRGWVGPRTVLGAVVKKRKSHNSNAQNWRSLEKEKEKKKRMYRKAKQIK
jgi:hypothetical protein